MYFEKYMEKQRQNESRLTSIVRRMALQVIMHTKKVVCRRSLICGSEGINSI